MNTAESLAKLPTTNINEINSAIDKIGTIILGKNHVIRLALTCLIARGHLLIEDLPGVGKTTLVYALAKTLGLEIQRIQFTSDLLPADILGSSIYNPKTNQFKFHPGPIFSNIVLGDEINRTTPKTQSGLLESMAEFQVTVEGVTYPLPEPFFVIATQNPTDQVGTYPLPESQLDRFMMCISIGYPDPDTERKLLRDYDHDALLQKISAVLNIEDMLTLQKSVPHIIVADPILDYLQQILRHSRETKNYNYGLSPRAGLAILNTTRAWALLHNRHYVIPEDIQTILPHVIKHRLIPHHEEDKTDIMKKFIQQIPIP